LTVVEALDVPKMEKDVHTFLGITGYYRRFIPNYSSLAAPLNDLTRKSAPNQMVCDAGCAQAFGKLKKLLCQDPILHNPDFDKLFILQTDASERGVGAVLSQKRIMGLIILLHITVAEGTAILDRGEGMLGDQVWGSDVPGVSAWPKFTVQTDHYSLVWLDRL
jgi:phospholipid-translocating ATPase